MTDYISPKQFHDSEGVIPGAPSRAEVMPFGNEADIATTKGRD